MRTHHPQRRFAGLEARPRIGGTWDLFRYPGIRSDSDLHTFGFDFKPWVAEHAFASGGEILAYLSVAVSSVVLPGSGEVCPSSLTSSKQPVVTVALHCGCEDRPLAARKASLSP